MRNTCSRSSLRRASLLPLGLWAGLLGGVLGGAPGCSKGPTGPGLKLQVADLAGELTCKRNLAAVPFTPLLREGTLRLSVLRRDPDGTHLQCDLTTSVPNEKPSIDLGPVDRSRVDIFAELFDKSGMRVLSGAALGTTIALADGVPQSLPLFPVGNWSCPAGLMATARAFHSATMLPNGEVLLLGGLDAVQNYGTDVFGVLGSAEIYDPRKGVFTALTSTSGALTARAFHSAAVLSSTDTQIRILVYGGVTAPMGLPVLLVPNAASPVRLAPAGNAAPATAELLVYDLTNRTITSSPVPIGPHSTAFAGGAGLYGGGLLAVGGSTFMPSGAFSRSNPTTLEANVEVGAFTARGTDAPSFVFSSMAPNPWLLAPSVTPLSATTALVLGAKTPSMDGDSMLALQLSGLPQALTFVNQSGTPLTGSVATGYHTATRLGPALSATPVTGDEQILVTGGFQMAPQTLGQPPSPQTAVRLYTVHDPMGSITPIDYKAIATYNQNNVCNNTTDGHYRPAGFEAATATPSGQKVVITGGTPTVRSGATPCVDCEPGDPATSKLLCALRQVSLYNATTQLFTAGPKLSLGRLGHQQTTLRDGTILVTGGLIRPGGELTAATSESEVYNPRAADATGLDPEDPVVAVLDEGQKAMRQGMGLASPCAVLN